MEYYLDIEVLADRHEEEQAILQELAEEEQTPLQELVEDLSEV